MIYILESRPRGGARDQTRAAEFRKAVNRIRKQTPSTPPLYVGEKSGRYWHTPN